MVVCRLAGPADSDYPKCITDEQVAVQWTDSGRSGLAGSSVQSPVHSDDDDDDDD